MVDRILDFNGDVAQTKKFEDEVVNKANPREIFLFAKYVKGANIQRLLSEILSLNDKEYIHYFLYSIKLENYDKIIEKIVEFNDASLLFYAFYDTDGLSSKNILTLLNALVKTEHKRYLFLFLYYYFNILKYNEEEVIKIARTTMEIKEELSIPEYLESVRSEFEDKKEKDYNYFSKNCYKGRKGNIPDIIVCHITKDYYKAIKILYDESKEVSSHFIIGSNGEIKQIVSLYDSAWANGTTCNSNSDLYYRFSTNDIVRNRKINANLYTFSIEHISLDGSLTKKQYDATIKVFKKIIDFVKNEYNIDFKIDKNHIIGHKNVNPIVRSKDPGENYPFEKIIEDLKEIYKN